MPESEVPQPIINPPYDEPAWHWKIHQHEPAEKMCGRRKATYTYLPPGSQRNQNREQPADNESGGQVIELELVSQLRQRLAKWRPSALKGKDGVSRVTMELLNYWWREGRQHRLFFAQLEAAETIIFLTEARADLRQGISIPPDTPGAEKERDGFTAFERRCCRMATGSGKTTVMAMLAAWSILNKVHNKQDKRFSDAVLVVCPNVTIRDRLAELNPNNGDTSIYRTRDLVPPAMMSQLARGRVLTTNWHVFEPHSTQTAGNRVVKSGRRVLVRETVKIGDRTNTARGTRYMTEHDLRKQSTLGLLTIKQEYKDKNDNLIKVDIEAEKYIESDTALVRRVLEKELGTHGNILVFNDEAHHAYRLQTDDDREQDDLLDDEMTEEYYREATVWIDGLDRIHKSRQINVCIDFSATPYFLGRAGNNSNRIFPWTVSSFDLQDAIEAGLVKIPQLVVRDSSGSKIPGYFNIWQWILPRLTPAERGGRRAGAKPEAILKWAYTPITMLGTKWEQLRQEMEASDDPRPPVFIIVCKTKKLADIIYQWLACNESPTTDIPSARLPGLRNDKNNENTIRVYSDMQKEIDSGNTKSDETRWMRYTLDTIGKTAWPRDRQGREQYPEGFAELAAKMGRAKHPPGRDVRCIVSVGMLTEGWDCNTVTHIIGLRPFMSQLLCEQVVGRGLRRISYEVDENGLMSEELAQVFGVPLSAFTVKGGGGGEPKEKRHRIYALPQRKHLEIRFPRVEGYRQAVRNRIVCDMEHTPSLTIDIEKIPQEVEMKAGLPDNSGRPSLHGPGKMNAVGLQEFRNLMRLQQRIWEMTAALTEHYTHDPDCRLPKGVAFAQLYRIVEIYINEKIIAPEPADKRDAFSSPYYGYIIEQLHQNIRPDERAGEAPELPRYERLRDSGSTAEVDFYTRREPYSVNKSHLNAVVPDTKRLEQSAAWHLDHHPKVYAFVKNENMGFGIPYLHDGEMHDYLPDFIARLNATDEHDKPGADDRYIIIETKGYDPIKEVKQSAAERWVNAVNADGRYGRWSYKMVAKASEINAAINTA